MFSSLVLCCSVRRVWSLPTNCQDGGGGGGGMITIVISLTHTRHIAAAAGGAAVPLLNHRWYKQ